MRLRETIKIDDKEITVKELTVRQVKEMWNQMDVLFSREALLDFQKLAPLFEYCVEGLKLEDLEDMAPSEIKKVMDAFSGVNAVFFDLTKKLEGENPLLGQMSKALVATLIAKFAASSKKDTTESGTTDGASTLPPSE